MKSRTRGNQLKWFSKKQQDTASLTLSSFILQSLVVAGVYATCQLTSATCSCHYFTDVQHGLESAHWPSSQSTWTFPHFFQPCHGLIDRLSAYRHCSHVHPSRELSVKLDYITLSILPGKKKDFLFLQCFHTRQNLSLLTYFPCLFIRKKKLLLSHFLPHLPLLHIRALLSANTSDCLYIGMASICLHHRWPAHMFTGSSTLLNHSTHTMKQDTAVKAPRSLA